MEAGQKLSELDLAEIERKKSINNLIQQTNLEAVQSEFEKQQEMLRIQEETALAELEKLRATEEEKLAIKQGYEELNKQLNEDRQRQIDEILDEKKFN